MYDENWSPNWSPLTAQEKEQFEAEYGPLREQLQQAVIQGAPATEIERLYAEMNAVLELYI